MQSPIGTTLGIELEVNGDAQEVSNRLAEAGWCDAGQHGYHCDCPACDFSTGLLWRHQRDSTVDGEFISRIFHDWASVRHGTEVLGAALQASDVSVGLNTGLHIHVGASVSTWPRVVSAYLRYERWMQRLGAGPYADKREGMNCTVLDAAREVGGYAPGEHVTWSQAREHARSRIADDRHCDINFSNRYGTYEFRVFNSTLEPWQMELAARLTVVFCHFSPYDPSPSDGFINPPRASRTLRPPIEFDEFCSLMVQYDSELRPLIERHLGREIVEPVARPERVRPPRRSSIFYDDPEPEPEDEPNELSPQSVRTLAACGCIDCRRTLREYGYDVRGERILPEEPEEPEEIVDLSGERWTWIDEDGGGRFVVVPMGQVTSIDPF